MASNKEIIDDKIEGVHQLIDVVKERIEEGPDNREWLIDYNLPALYIAIEGLYDALGEREILEQARPVASE